MGLEQPVVIAMVGLPARGKSYLVKMLTRYLRWSGFDTKVFNVGSYRREIGLAGADSSFFDNKNKDANKVREDLAMKVQTYMYSWLHETTTVVDDITGESYFDKRRVAIFDATNTTIARRHALSDKAREENVFLLYVESICNDQAVLNRNYDMKLQNDDYKGMDPTQAREDFLKRVQAYERVYETIVDTEENGNISYIKLENVGEKMITRNCSGYLPSQVAFYLQNVHIQPRKIYLTLVAECAGAISEVNSPKSGKLIAPCPSPGSETGRTFARRTTSFNSNSGKHSGKHKGEARGDTIMLKSISIDKVGDDIKQQLSTDLNEDDLIENSVDTPLHLLDFLMEERDELLSNKELTGPAKEIALLLGNSQIHLDIVTSFKNFSFPCFHTPILNELRGGSLHGLTIAEIKELYPEEFQKRQENKLKYRYPGVGGESYLDVIERVRPIIIELERQRQNMFLVCHLAVIRCIYAYFMGVDLPDIPFVEFKMNNVYELEPGPHGCLCTIIEYEEEEEEEEEDDLDSFSLKEEEEEHTTNGEK